MYKTSHPQATRQKKDETRREMEVMVPGLVLKDITYRSSNRSTCVRK